MMRLPSRVRLGLLLGVLAALWAYAILTDHPAPAWGASRLPDLYFATIVYVSVTALAVVAIRAWSSWRGRGEA